MQIVSTFTNEMVWFKTIETICISWTYKSCKSICNYAVFLVWPNICVFVYFMFYDLDRQCIPFYTTAKISFMDVAPEQCEFIDCADDGVCCGSRQTQSIFSNLGHILVVILKITLGRCYFLLQNSIVIALIGNDWWPSCIQMVCWRAITNYVDFLS